MKEPYWKDAPEWANFKAKDADGQWWWYENKPEHGSIGWATSIGGRCCVAEAPSWKESLQERPK